MRQVACLACLIDMQGLPKKMKQLHPMGQDKPLTMSAGNILHCAGLLHYRVFNGDMQILAKAGTYVTLLRECSG